jgi:hypothetical protein
MATQQKWFIEERARALAVVYLTRHRDIQVLPPPENSHFDILVSIGKAERLEPWLFAVEVRGTLRQRVKETPSGEYFFPLNYSAAMTKGSEIPVCMFLFTVDDDRGFYRWLHEPILSAQGAELVPMVSADEGTFSAGATFRPLDDQAIAGIISQVAEWHEQRKRMKTLSMVD